MNQYIPFMLQSTLNAYIPILTAAYFKSIADGVDVEKSGDAGSAIFKLISLINEHLSDQSKGLTDESLAVAMSMAYNDTINISRQADCHGTQEGPAVNGPSMFADNSISYPIIQQLKAFTE